MISDMIELVSKVYVHHLQRAAACSYRNRVVLSLTCCWDIEM
jgi:hypothetical protein